jgi:class II lanthipeptide synthase
MSSRDAISVAWRGSFLSERVQVHGEGTSRPSAEVEAALNQLERDWTEFGSPFSEILDELESAVSRDRLSSSQEPPWIDFFAGVPEANAAAEPRFLGSVLANAVQQVPFGPAIAPLLTRADVAFLRSIPLRFVDQAAVARSFAASLAGMISELVCFTLYVELCAEVGCDVARLPENENAEATSRFCENVARSGWTKIVSKYPVLGRLVFQRLHQSCAALLTLAERLRLDLGEISRIFGRVDARAECASDTLPVTQVDFGLSDPHNGGQTVCCLTLVDGKRLIYKPKPLANELWFHDVLLPRLSAHHLPFARLKVLARRDYGWVQHAESAEADNGARIDDVIGSAAALTWLVQATDLHCENVVLRERSLVLVDLETLLCTPTFMAVRKNAQALRGISVVGSGLFRESASIMGEATEPSGLFDARVVATYSHAVFSIGPEGGLHLSKADKGTAGRGERRSCFDPKEVDEQATVTTFVRVVQALRGDEAFQRALRETKGLVSRHVFRPTSFYMRVWQRLLQPQFLTDGALFSLELHRLFETCRGLGESESAYLASVVRSEIRQIQDGDVPFFWALSGSTSLYAPEGLVQDGFFARPPQAHALEHLAECCPRLIAQEARTLSVVLSVAREAELSEAAGAAPTPLRSLRRLVLDVVSDVATSLLTASFLHREGRTSWVSYSGAVDGNRMFPYAEDRSLYGGSLGILAFLSTARHNLAVQQGRRVPGLDDFLHAEQERLRALDEAGLRALALPENGSIGLVGLGGAMLACALVSDHEIAVLEPLTEFLLMSGPEFLKAQSDKGTEWDVISGLAGCTLGACAFIRKYGDRLNDCQKGRMTALIRMALDGLQASPDRVENGVTWSHRTRSEDLVGMAHGTLGAAAALSVGAAVLESQEGEPVNGVAEVTQDAIRHCESYRERASRLWTDNRVSGGTGGVVNSSWCHGLAGIGQAYLALSETTSKYEETLALIVRQLEHWDQGPTDSYCCGTAGVLDFLLQYSRRYGSQAVTHRIERQLGKLLDSLARTGRFRALWGSTSAGHFPGLFQGAAGIAFVALRSLDPTVQSLGGLGA